MTTARKPAAKPAAKKPAAKPAPVAPAPAYPAGLDPRVKKALNIEMPETEHWRLKNHVAGLPGRASMQRFILEAIDEKLKRGGA